MEEMDLENTDFSRALEGALHAFHLRDDDDNHNAIVKLLILGCLYDEKTLFAAHFEDGPKSIEDLKEEAVFKGLTLDYVTLNNGDKYYVMYSRPSKIQDFPCESLMADSLYKLLIYANNDENISGVLINPGPDNFLLPKGLIGIIVDYVKENNAQE